jgi:hypothetical protein
MCCFGFRCGFGGPDLGVISRFAIFSVSPGGGIRPRRPNSSPLTLTAQRDEIVFLLLGHVPPEQPRAVLVLVGEYPVSRGIVGPLEQVVSVGSGVLRLFVADRLEVNRLLLGGIAL